MNLSLLFRSICRKTDTLLSFFQAGIFSTGYISGHAICRLICLTAAGIPLSMDAVPAWPGTQIVTQLDGSTLELRLLGDEYGHITVDAASGTAVQIDRDGFWKPSGEEVQKALNRRKKNRSHAQHRLRTAIIPANRRSPLADCACRILRHQICDSGRSA